MSITINAIVILATFCFALLNLSLATMEWQAPSPSVAWSPFVLPIPLPSSLPSLPPAWKFPEVPAAAPYGPTQYVVGDDNGWTLGVDYAAWARGKTFRVGDSLVFKYAQGNHDVYKVGGPEFSACSVPANGEVLASGNDIITLATAGRKWYICGVSNGWHCMAGQRLAITVEPAAEYWEESPSPSPSPMVSPSVHPVAAAPAAEPYTFFNRFLKK